MLSRRILLATPAAGFCLGLADGWLRPVRAQLLDPLAPWTVAPHADPRIAAAAWAVLSPNPHNRQPWLLRLIGQDSLALHGDLDRRLPVTDPSPASCCGAVPRPIPSSPPPRSAARPSSPSTPCARCRRR